MYLLTETNDFAQVSNFTKTEVVIIIGIFCLLCYLLSRVAKPVK
jgi:hypothetical protein